MGKCGACDKDKSKDKGGDTSMKGQTSSFELMLVSGSSITMKDSSRLEAQAMLMRMGGGTLRSTSS